MDFLKNRFINEYARKKKAKVSESRNHGVSESRIYLSEIYVEELTFLIIKIL